MKIKNNIKWEHPIYVFDEGKYIGKIYNDIELIQLRCDLVDLNEYKKLDLISYFGDSWIDSHGKGLENINDKFEEYYLTSYEKMLVKIMECRCNHNEV